MSLPATCAFLAGLRNSSISGRGSRGEKNSKSTANSKSKHEHLRVFRTWLHLSSQCRPNQSPSRSPAPSCGGCAHALSLVFPPVGAYICGRIPSSPCHGRCAHLSKNRVLSHGRSMRLLLAMVVALRHASLMSALGGRDKAEAGLVQRGMAEAGVLNTPVRCPASRISLEPTSRRNF